MLRFRRKMNHNIDLYELAVKFRSAIDTANSLNEFDWRSCFSKFPDDCCDMTCDLLGEYLKEQGIRTYQINGESKFNHQRRHVWLVTCDEIVIDITGDQFSGQQGFDRFIEPVVVGNETSTHKVFCRKRYREENTLFLDPQYYNGFGNTPNYRQSKLIEAYAIIKKHLDE